LGLHSERFTICSGLCSIAKQMLGREIGLTVDGYYHVVLVYTEMDARLFVLGDLAYNG